MLPCIPKKTLTKIFKAMIFIIIPNWKQLKCPGVVKWVDKVCYVHTVDYYEAMSDYITAAHNS